MAVEREHKHEHEQEHGHSHGHGDSQTHEQGHDHGHGHEHDDAHGHGHSHGSSLQHDGQKQGVRERVHGASPAASVILELSERIGALIIDADAGLDGAEIEISLPGAPARTHSMVRERLTQPVRQYSAVYPSLEAGEYTVWRLDGDAAGTVVVLGGHVARFAYSTAHEVTPS